MLYVCIGAAAMRVRRVMCGRGAAWCEILFVWGNSVVISARARSLSNVVDVGA